MYIHSGSVRRKGLIVDESFFRRGTTDRLVGTIKDDLKNLKKEGIRGLIRAFLIFLIGVVFCHASILGPKIMEVNRHNNIILGIIFLVSYVGGIITMFSALALVFLRVQCFAACVKSVYMRNLVDYNFQDAEHYVSDLKVDESIPFGINRDDFRDIFGTEHPVIERDYIVGK